MSLSHIGADDEEGVRRLDVSIGAHRFISAEGGDIARNGACHTGAGVAVDVVCADTCPHNLLHSVGLFSEGLTGAVEANGIGTVLLNGLFEFADNKVHSLVPASLDELPVFFDERVKHAVFSVNDFWKQDTFNAEAPFVDSTIGVAFDGYDFVAGDACQDAAACAAVATDAFNPFVSLFGLDRSLLSVAFRRTARRQHSSRGGYCLQKVTS